MLRSSEWPEGADLSGWHLLLACHRPALSTVRRTRSGRGGRGAACRGTGGRWEGREHRTGGIGEGKPAQQGPIRIAYGESERERRPLASLPDLWGRSGTEIGSCGLGDAWDEVSWAGGHLAALRSWYARFSPDSPKYPVLGHTLLGTPFPFFLKPQDISVE